MDDKEYTHFKGKDAFKHIVEVQAEGLLSSAEIHGAETPGAIFAGCDSAKDSSLLIVSLILLLYFFEFTKEQILTVFCSFALGWIFWKFGRSSLIAWARLERLHRVVQEEHYEIVHHREQEREELKALYKAKGFHGKLLDDVIDVLMADGDRLLRVMLEEELGFRLEENEHPLIQGLGAGIGAFLGVFFPLIGYYYFDILGLVLGGILILTVASCYSALREQNHVIRAIFWNVGIAFFAYSSAYFLMKFVMH